MRFARDAREYPTRSSSARPARVFVSGSMFSDYARSSGIREGRQERAAIRTWTLDALRAATEPVKVEAMQAIVEVGFGLKSGWCVQGMASTTPPARFCYSERNGDSPNVANRNAAGFGNARCHWPERSIFANRDGLDLASRGNRIPGKIELS